MPVELTTLTAEQRLGLCSALGVIKISSVEISSPVEHVDIVLPVGYDLFDLEVYLTLSSGSYDPLHFLFSEDGGSTWNENTVYDYVACSSSAAAGNPTVTTGTGIAVGIFAAGTVSDDPGASFRSNAKIYPGSAIVPPEINIQSHYDLDGSNYHVIEFVSAKMPTVLARQNGIRIGANLAGDTLATGTFTLFGRPSS